jgi:hypothetical protein
MRTKFLSLLCLMLVLVFCAPAPARKRSKRYDVVIVPAEMKHAAKTHASGGCDTSLWEHVYRKRRLLVVQPCVRLTGTIQSIKPERDGDEHIRLRLDPADQVLLNHSNLSQQRGALVLEPVCESEPTQRTAWGACRDFRTGVPLPRRGARVTVLGPYVLDQEHGWMEIHPVTRMTVEP